MTIKTKIQALKNELNNLDPSDCFSHEEYDDFLNDVYGVVEVCGHSYAASYALKRLDRIAYDCGFNDWLDDQDITETERYKELAREIAELEDEGDDYVDQN